MTKVIVLIHRLLRVLPFGKAISLLEEISRWLLGACLSGSNTALSLGGRLYLGENAGRFVLLDLCEGAAAFPTLEGNRGFVNHYWGSFSFLLLLLVGGGHTRLRHNPVVVTA